ncbi:ribosome biogenesis GTPase YlqF [Porticoccaceae bacterium]|jgi:ribosome biogenesis GTPase A|nr:ribosome biogenesis GTPase YlqF [Porticoccaceae bacterium]MDC1476753.1 ribosome biogenesis GTPase YlqF [Porticoccaceae bacterium]CAI8300120.1 MAG: Ribosome biogenesis GTPase A [SAR92 bacterium MED-G29]
MSIHWYPGHMRKASNEMIEALPLVNVVVEVLDARIPFSSSNPFIQGLCAEKPYIKLLNKTDLADPEITKQWQDYFEQQANTKTLALDLKNYDPSKQIIDLINKLSPHKEGRNTLAMVTGIPNVGKSSLINCLAGRHVTKTGDEPAVTKGQQRINLRNGIMLLDTPGILWPKIENPQGSYRLATTGAIKDTAVSYEDLAFFAAEFLLEKYPERLKERFNVSELPRTEIELLEIIGAQRGCLRSGGRVDLERVSTIFINELRAGVLGPLGFETPEMIELEMQHVEVLKAEKEEREKLRLEKSALRRKKANANRK